MASDRSRKPASRSDRTPSGRFAPGISGNGNGRPPKARPDGIAEAVAKARRAKVLVTEGGRTKRMDKGDIAAAQLWNQSAAGDKGALKLAAQLEREAAARASAEPAPAHHSESDVAIVARLVVRIRAGGSWT